MKQITYLSKLDNTMQPALVWEASGTDARPLAVCLHTWSYGLEQPCDHFLEQCRIRNWHFIFPYFRGPNWKPEACGSDLVVSDLVCAVSYMQENYAVDENKIYLVGGSGGGHASLLMAGRKPELFTAISSWCPISDIAAWYRQVNAKKEPGVRSYDDHIAEACGGNPVTSAEAAEQAKRRSPLTWMTVTQAVSRSPMRSMRLMRLRIRKIGLRKRILPIWWRRNRFRSICAFKGKTRPMASTKCCCEKCPGTCV